MSSVGLEEGSDVPCVMVSVLVKELLGGAVQRNVAVCLFHGMVHSGSVATAELAERGPAAP